MSVASRKHLRIFLGLGRRPLAVRVWVEALLDLGFAVPLVDVDGRPAEMEVDVDGGRGAGGVAIRSEDVAVAGPGAVPTEGGTEVHEREAVAFRLLLEDLVQQPTITSEIARMMLQSREKSPKGPASFRWL